MKVDPSYLLPADAVQHRIWAASHKSAQGKEAATTMGRKPTREVSVMTERDRAARMIYALFGVIVMLAAFLDRTSLSYLLLHQDGGGWVMLAISGGAILLTLDWFINDLMPHHVTFEWAYRHRVKFYMASAFLYVIPMFAATRVDSRAATFQALAIYGGMVAVGVYLAARTAVARHKYSELGEETCDI